VITAKLLVSKQRPLPDISLIANIMVWFTSLSHEIMMSLTLTTLNLSTYCTALLDGLNSGYLNKKTYTYEKSYISFNYYTDFKIMK
jgi:hypothetical protein